ncbi:MAG TPA: histidine phosphatase family protein, partial [Spirillospora sp.]|nr:histidine phosphatase family protein [Spirillospora sp.]
MEVYLIRHGQSVNNALGSPAGRSHDPELTEIGFRQAEILAAHLADGECPESKWSGPRGGG